MDDKETAEQTLAEALEAEFDKQVAEQPPENDPPVEAPPENDPEKQEDPEVSPPVEAEAPPEVSAPEHWSDEAKTIFLELDERGREFALSQEKLFSEGIEEKSTELKQFRDALEPYKHLIPAGTSEAQAIQQLFNAQAYLQRDPVEGVKWLMQSYGVDEKQFAPTEQPKDDIYVDPEVKALKERIEALTNQSEQDRVNAEQARQNAMLSEIQKFKEAEDEGSLLHPHFDAVYGVMAGLLQSGRAADMEEAYEKAVWSVPEYREAEVTQKAKEFAEKELADKQAAAEKAAKAGKTVEGKKSANTAPKEKTLTDSLSENYEKSIRGEL